MVKWVLENHHFTKGSKMKITQEEVTHVANLSSEILSRRETAEFATTLSKIVDMAGVGRSGLQQAFANNDMADRKILRRISLKGTDRDRLFRNVPEKIITTSRYQLS